MSVVGIFWCQGKLEESNKCNSKWTLTGIDEIININDLNLRNYHINFCNHDIDIDNYSIVSFENLTVRGQESQYIHIDTI
jgi:hypothetical protein